MSDAIITQPTMVRQRDLVFNEYHELRSILLMLHPSSHMNTETLQSASPSRPHSFNSSEETPSSEVSSSDGTVAYIAHPMFHHASAEQELFGEDGSAFDLVPVGKRLVLLPAEERLLFLQFNYCWFRVAMLMAQWKGNVPAGEQAAMMRWRRAALVRRDRLVECNMGLVALMIRQFRREHTDYDEMQSDGSLTLLRAVDKFDVDRGFRFSTYACQAIHHALVLAASRRWRRPQTSLASCMDLVENEPDTGIFAGEAPAVREMILRNEASLTPTELQVIHSRFALSPKFSDGMPAAPMTREQIGRMIGVSKERIRQIEHNALSKLRSVLDGVYGPEAMSM